MAVKRLPNFPTAEQRRRHVELMTEYIGILHDRGVEVVPTRFDEVDGDDGRRVVFAVQMLVEPARLADQVLRQVPDAEGERILAEIVQHTAAVAGQPMYGLDAQLSNWVVAPNGDLLYLDITTPFVRDYATGLSRLDTRVLVASLPWLLRWVVQRYLAGEIVREYFELRTTLVNTIANLLKERLEGWVPRAVELANEVVDDPITTDEIRRYYDRDRRMWEVLQRLRRFDRWWQWNVRRRPYPVLLPGRIDR